MRAEEFASWGQAQPRLCAADLSPEPLELKRVVWASCLRTSCFLIFILIQTGAPSAECARWLTLKSNLLQLPQKVVMAKDGNKPVICTQTIIIMATSDYEITIKRAKGQWWDSAGGKVGGCRGSGLCGSQRLVRVHRPKICWFQSEMNHLVLRDSPRWNATAVSAGCFAELHAVRSKQKKDGGFAVLQQSVHLFSSLSLWWCSVTNPALTKALWELHPLIVLQRGEDQGDILTM